MYHTNFILKSSLISTKDNDLKIKWQQFGTGPLMIEAFKRKKLDIGYIGLPPAIIGIDQGVQIKCIAGGHIEGTILVGKKELNSDLDLNNKLFEVFNQFIGKTIGVPSRGSIHDVILNYYLKKYNMTDSIKVKNYKQAELIALDLRENKLIAGVGTPALSAFASTIFDSKILIHADNLWNYNPSYGIVALMDIIRNNSEDLVEFLQLHKQACEILRNDRDKAIKLIKKNSALFTKDYIRKVIEISPKFCAALPDNYVESTMRFIKQLMNLGYLKKELKINDVFYYDLIKRVHPEKAHYKDSD